MKGKHKAFPEVSQGTQDFSSLSGYELHSLDFRLILLHMTFHLYKQIPVFAGEEFHWMLLHCSVVHVYVCFFIVQTLRLIWSFCIRGVSSHLYKVLEVSFVRLVSLLHSFRSQPAPLTRLFSASTCYVDLCQTSVGAFRPVTQPRLR